MFDDLTLGKDLLGTPKIYVGGGEIVEGFVVAVVAGHEVGNGVLQLPGSKLNPTR